MRQACSHRLGSAVCHWAGVAAQRDVRSRLRHSALPSRDHPHGRALRAIADRLPALAYAIQKSRTPYDSGTLPAMPDVT